MMAEPIISVQNLSKQYLISHVRDRALLSNYVEALLQKVKGFFSFFSQKSSAFGGENGKLNALDDVSFNIARGSRVGILGTNGAGKSTLLKILSNIIEPTAGKVKVNGNVISLLEVGIGFHAELTARENILLHRTIQAMPEAEIWKKIDEITDFAENEQFLDVPLSQYSSGMYMRFAFAMAAHLEPEILIVDEVLAVCDAAFQKKCIKKCAR
jgi:lipopolysaccharide transport system ATP-binding protein